MLSLPQTPQAETRRRTRRAGGRGRSAAAPVSVDRDDVELLLGVEVRVGAVGDRRAPRPAPASPSWTSLPGGELEVVARGAHRDPDPPRRGAAARPAGSPAAPRSASRSSRSCGSVVGVLAHPGPHGRARPSGAVSSWSPELVRRMASRRGELVGRCPRGRGAATAPGSSSPIRRMGHAPGSRASTRSSGRTQSAASARIHPVRTVDGAGQLVEVPVDVRLR